MKKARYCPSYYRFPSTIFAEALQIEPGEMLMDGEEYSWLLNNICVLYHYRLIIVTLSYLIKQLLHYCFLKSHFVYAMMDTLADSVVTEMKVGMSFALLAYTDHKDIVFKALNAFN